MLLSMTGYGKAEAIVGDRKIHVEIKSLNSKNIDITTHIATTYFAKDLEIRGYLTKRLSRGKVDFNLWTESVSGAQAAGINTETVGAYVDQIKSISSQLHIDEPHDWWSVISQLPGITQQAPAEEVSDEEWQQVSDIITQATDRLIDFRKQEGAAVRLKFDTSIDAIAQLLAEVAPYEKARIERIRGEIVAGLKQLDGVDYDHNRLEQEMIYYIAKLDINEEKQRLANHLRYFRQTMDGDPGQGKKLGFISQEMGREINTLGSKSNQADMQNLVVKMKDQLEQIKEQVLNVL